ncbi:response regulator [Paraburkholderia phenazinium]|uniref:Response regulator receiver domain-containing protein n=1 Tax=Paraburkholderia phenazinium TaxID=60549 RepID=A0A1N6FHG5_9BURK|nr:response regulator [Paraburkholderia phenazinium]SIN94721.1 Response regulator receiver domain-containing protein [Paraburkholderia phenazinium]
MKLNVLVVEDDEFKQRHIVDFLGQQDWCGDSIIACSVVGGIAQIDESEFDLVILDMALPNYDGGSDAGQGLGGIAVFRYLRQIAPCVPVVVLTQFEALREGSALVDTETLKSRLEHEFGLQFAALAKYKIASDEWKHCLNLVANSVRNK